MEPRQQYVLPTAKCMPKFEKCPVLCSPLSSVWRHLGTAVPPFRIGDLLCGGWACLPRPRLVEDVWVIARDLGLCSV